MTLHAAQISSTFTLASLFPRRRRFGGRLHHKLGAAVALLCALALALPSAADAPLAVGDPAPSFELRGSDGKLHRLADYAGKTVVIAWFPRAFTQGCTIECKSLAANSAALRRVDMSYFMASVDPPEDNARFARSENADFPILSDPTKATARAYGVLGPSGVAMRHTVYIGTNGRIAWIDRNVRPATSAEDMLARLRALGVPAR